MMSKPAPEVVAPTHSCRSTRSDLEGYLRESKFGADAAVFGCFFVPASMPPRCVVCQRLIGEHEDRDAAAVAVAAAAVAMGTLGTAATPDREITRLTITSHATNINLSYHTRKLKHDTFYDWFITAGMGIVLLVVFGVFDMGPLSYGILAMSVFMLVVAFILASRARTLTVTFDKGQRQIKIVNARTWYPCIRSVHEVDFDAVSAIVPTTSVDGQEMRMMLICDGLDGGLGTTEIEVDVVSQGAAHPVMLGWQQYLTDLGVALSNGTASA